MATMRPLTVLPGILGGAGRGSGDKSGRVGKEGSSGGRPGTPLPPAAVCLRFPADGCHRHSGLPFLVIYTRWPPRLWIRLWLLPGLLLAVAGSWRPNADKERKVAKVEKGGGAKSRKGKKGKQSYLLAECHRWWELRWPRERPVVFLAPSRTLASLPVFVSSRLWRTPLPRGAFFSFLRRVGHCCFLLSCPFPAYLGISRRGYRFLSFSSCTLASAPAPRSGRAPGPCSIVYIPWRSSFAVLPPSFSLQPASSRVHCLFSLSCGGLAEDCLDCLLVGLPSAIAPGV